MYSKSPSAANLRVYVRQAMFDSNYSPVTVFELRWVQFSYRAWFRDSGE